MSSRSLQSGRPHCKLSLLACCHTLQLADHSNERGPNYDARRGAICCLDPAQSAVINLCRSRSPPSRWRCEHTWRTCGTAGDGTRTMRSSTRRLARRRTTQSPTCCGTTIGYLLPARHTAACRQPSYCELVWSSIFDTRRLQLTVELYACQLQLTALHWQSRAVRAWSLLDIVK